MQDSKWEDYYQVLGVDSEASPDEIRRAYRALTMEYHPDRQAGATEGVRRLAEEKQKQINQAYKILGNPQKRPQYHQEWVRRKSPPKPLADPANLLFRNVAPGEIQTGSFTIRNHGGPYERLWISNPDSWVRVTGYASQSDTDELPLRVELEAKGQEWEKSYSETITVRLDSVETTVRVELHTKPAPAPAHDSWVPRPAGSGAGTWTTPAGASATPRASGVATVRTPAPPTSHAPVAVRLRTNRKFIVTASLVFAVAMILALAGAAIGVLQDVKPWERPVWSISLPGSLRATPIDANADHVMDEVAAISWRRSGTPSDSIKLLVIGKEGSVKSTQELFAPGDNAFLLPPSTLISFRNMVLYPIDYDLDGVINELYFYVDDVGYYTSGRVFEAVLLILNAQGKILWLWNCTTWTYDSGGHVIVPNCSEDEAAEKHSRMLTEYVYPVYDEVQNYPRAAKDWKNILRIKDDGTVESYPRSTSLTYSIPPWWSGNRNFYGGDPSVSPDGKLTALVKPSGDWYHGYSSEISIVNSVTQETQTSVSMSKGSWRDGIVMTWSPDGEKLALQATSNLITKISANVKIIDLASDEQYDISCGYESSKLVWSPDSLKLAFEGRQCRSLEQYPPAEEYTNYVYVYNVGGKELTIVALGLVRYGQ